MRMQQWAQFFTYLGTVAILKQRDPPDMNQTFQYANGRGPGTSITATLT